jgi:hypothetical protein
MIRIGAAAVLAALVLAGCTSGDGDGGRAAPPATTAAPSGSATGSATPSASPTPDLPDGCEILLPFGDLDEALGRPLFGQSRFTKGVAQPSIGRTGRITCQYGLNAQGKGTPQVEVGISDYTDAEAATKRVQATVAAERGAGATQGEATVGGIPATLLGGGKVVTLVLAQGSRTVAVTLQRTLAPSLGTGVNLNKAITAVAEKVLANLPGS